MKSIYKIIAILILSYSLITPQELSVGTDIVSRYIWRGSDLGNNNPSIQPTIELSAGGFGAGFWGAYPLSDPAALNEIDFYISYSVSLGNAGDFSIGFTDYMNPNSGTKIGNFNNYDDPEGPGVHFIELNIAYGGSESFPLAISFNYFLHNVKNNPIYIELGYSTSIKDVSLDLFLGATPGDDAMYYGTDSFNVINLGITAGKSIKITDSFELPVFGSLILNPATENLYYVIGISL
ncbi:TorF family putative porin [Melioribacter sp. OK-6-Me]|uniref:TorF family putative porin n=1 Tax=unclassified Melioribacter TaxID=2627329 RepID=UPI003ED85BF7